MHDLNMKWSSKPMYLDRHEPCNMTWFEGDLQLSFVNTIGSIHLVAEDEVY